MYGILGLRSRRMQFEIMLVIPRVQESMTSLLPGYALLKLDDI